MSQKVWSTINPTTTSGTMLAALLTDFKDALMTGLAGITRPTQLQAGGLWIDTSLQGAPNYYWIYKLWTGSIDIEVFRININSGFGGALTSESLFQVSQISADTVGAVQTLVKNRFEDNGQVLNGDVVGEIQFLGRTNTEDDPTVALIRWTATDDQGASAYGGTLSFLSTPDASSIIIEHLKFILGTVEVPVPLLANALRLGSQNIATAATIVQLNADYTVVEFTGSTATDIQGINSGGNTKALTIHNRSSAVVTVKHQHASAVEADRILLPGGLDYGIEPEGTIELIYVSAQSRWKLQSSPRIGVSQEKATIRGMWSKWTAPSDAPSTITVNVYRRKANRVGPLSSLVTGRGKLYQMGVNFRGQLGVGNVVDRSSPIAVLGGLQLSKLPVMRDMPGNNLYSMAALTPDGTAYSWGNNDDGQLGHGNVTPKSSPVAVLGGLKFQELYIGEGAMMGLTSDGTLYSWGRCSSGGLGVGDTTPRSSPVAVLGGLKFLDVVMFSFNDSGNIRANSIGIEKSTGQLYSWGHNGNGALGHGDTTNRSSPVLISALSSFKFKKVCGSFNGTSTTFYALTEDGDLYAWGRNNIGQVGVGDTTATKSTPNLISPGGIKFEDVYAIRTQGVIAKATTGDYYGWGTNNSQLGIGDSTHRSSPVLSVALSGFDFQEIYTGGDGTGGLFAAWGILNDGTAYAWGFGEGLGVGGGSPAEYSSPTLVAGGLKFAEIVNTFGTSGSVFGVTTNGNIYSWGENAGGALGVGDSTGRLSPTQILGEVGTDPTFDTDAITVRVTPSTEYSLKLGKGLCYFGNIPLGNDVEKITIDYSKRGN